MKDAVTGKKFGCIKIIFTSNAEAQVHYAGKFFQPCFWDALR